VLYACHTHGVCAGYARLMCAFSIVVHFKYCSPKSNRIMAYLGERSMKYDKTRQKATKDFQAKLIINLGFILSMIYCYIICLFSVLRLLEDSHRPHAAPTPTQRLYRSMPAPYPLYFPLFGAQNLSNTTFTRQKPHPNATCTTITLRFDKASVPNQFLFN